MKRVALLLILTVVTLAFYAPNSYAQDVQDFSFSSFEADYYLSKGSEDQSQMRIVEKLVAEFPDYNQNKGIVRAIPRSYQGRDLNINLLSVSRNGVREPIYDQYRSGPFLYVETGTEEYIKGTQTFEIEYTLENVIQDVGNQQELFWDVNGTGWQQRFSEVIARVHLSESIAQDFKREVTCYQGASGSNDPCTIVSAQEPTIEFNSTRALQSKETLTFALAFKSDTFAPYNEGFGGILRSTILMASALLLVTGFASLAYIKSKNRNAPGRGVIVPEYLPPKDTSVFFAAQFLKSREAQRGFQAQIMELAVKQNVIIKETEKNGLFSKNTVYSIELVHNENLTAEERVLIMALFGEKQLKGTQYVFRTSDTRLMQALRNLRTKTRNAIIASGYKKQIKNMWVPIFISIIGGAGAFFVTSQLYNLGAALSITDYPVVVALAHGILFALTIIIYSINPRPLTAKGRAIRDYLEGLRMYISLAEAERLSYLQSPKGASKTAISTDDKAQVLHLYEQLLPYAVLFNLEKEWLKVIGSYYEHQHQAPVWYAGSHSFNSAQLTHAISAVSRSAASSSGSSGFSGGSGAGGGGGGGGGGGR